MMEKGGEYEFKRAVNKLLLFGWFYDSYCSLGNLGKHFKRKVVRTASIEPGEIVVDIGCGTGVLIREAYKIEPKARYIGIDPDEKILAIAKDRLSKLGIPAELKEDYAEKLSLPSDSIDVVISSLVFHHFPNQVKKQVCEEIYRVMKPGGRVVIADFGPGRISPYIFEEKEYMEGNLKGLIPTYMQEAGLKNVSTVANHWPGVSIWSGVK